MFKPSRHNTQLLHYITIISITITMTTSYLYDYVLSPFYDQLALLLWPDSIHPNFITLLGGLFCFLSAICIQEDKLGWSCVLFTLYHMCDNMDGKHARRTAQTSRLGGVLDHFVDGSFGTLAGYRTMARFVFGVGPSQPLYWQGMHGWYCLWLAPHIVGHFSGHLSLGTKVFSVDEAFLLTSALLFGGWMTHGTMVLIPDVSIAQLLVQLFQVVSLTYGIGGAMFHFWNGTKQQKTLWNHLSLVVFVHFWYTGIVTPFVDEISLYTQWIPVLTLVLFGMES